MKIQQVLFINGWDSKDNYESFIDYLEKIEYNPYEIPKMKWRHSLAKDLWDDFFVINPEMPNKDCACYEEWKIMFEKTFPYFYLWV